MSFTGKATYSAGASLPEIAEDVADLVAPVFSHRLGLARQAGDALEERNAITAALKRIVSAIPLPT